MVVMGRVCAPHGLKGWVKIQPFTQAVEGLLDYPQWWLGANGHWQEHRIAESAVHGSMVAVRLDGITNREAAAGLRGKEVAVPRDAMPESGAGEYYWNDLLGMEVSQRDLLRLGTVANIFDTGANAVLVVAQDDKKELLIPFIQDVIVDVDLTARRMVVDWELN